MLRKSIFILCIFIKLNDATKYDFFTGAVASDALLKNYEANNTLSTCTIEIKACNATEQRRLDGSCNNLNNPARGTVNNPHPRVLPAIYSDGRNSRKAVSGKELRIPREVRTTLLAEGKSFNTDLTQLVPGFAIFAFGDIGSLHDIKFFLVNKTDCCSGGQNDYTCAPNIIPEDDPVHRFSGIRCMNMTRPIDYQYLGCTNDSTPAPIEEASAVYDMSQIYSSSNKARSFIGGQLTTEVENGIVWPPNGTSFCPANNPGQKCFQNYSNSLLPIQLLSTWFMRLHNYFATQLAAVNPGWDDNKLFYGARELIIAFEQQIHIYEWLSLLVGKQNLIDSGIASNCSGFRDSSFYDSSMFPAITLEYALVNRWFHVLQGGSAKMFDTDGTFIKDFPIVNATFRTGELAKGKNIFHLTQGNFRQPAAAPNHIIDPGLAELGLPYIQQSMDIPTSDLHKNRLFGLRPYIDYVHYCSGDNITSFDDLTLVMKEDRITLLKDVYEDVRDIDLMAGLWSERMIEGGHIPTTLACLLKDSINKTIRGDRHWFERAERPYAFTNGQLQEIRKASMALLLCTVGDGVTEIQKHAFLNISPENPLVSCDEIPKIDFSQWSDAFKNETQANNEIIQ